MSEVDKQKILASRKAVDAYRTAHTALYQKPWHKGIPEEHTPLLNIMLGAFKGLGFNTIQEFFDASERLNVQETGILDETIRYSRKDLSLLGLTSGMTPSVIAKDDGVELRLIEGSWGKEAELRIDERSVMSTIPQEHISMKEAVEQCPIGSRIFVGGLGLALVLLYLAQAGKAAEVIVCEIDMRVIRLLGNQVSQWFANNYPDFNLTIIQGDASVEITKQGKFDWIYIDLTAGAPSEFEKLAKLALTDSGVYTPYQSRITAEWSNR